MRIFDYGTIIVLGLMAAAFVIQYLITAGYRRMWREATDANRRLRDENLALTTKMQKMQGVVNRATDTVRRLGQRILEPRPNDEWPETIEEKR